MGNVSTTTLLVRLRVALACLAGRRGSEGCSAGLLAGGKHSQLHLCASTGLGNGMELREQGCRPVCMEGQMCQGFQTSTLTWGSLLAWICSACHPQNPFFYTLHQGPRVC